MKSFIEITSGFILKKNIIILPQRTLRFKYSEASNLMFFNGFMLFNEFTDIENVLIF